LFVILARHIVVWDLIVTATVTQFIWALVAVSGLLYFVFQQRLFDYAIEWAVALGKACKFMFKLGVGEWTLGLD
jgi:hypothetical protein